MKIKVLLFYLDIKKISAILLAIWLLSCNVLANKPDLFLLKTYNKKQNIIGWFMSEKLDGVRGFWNGNSLITRGGKVLNPPVWFTKNYPPFAIDGELWTKQADFENINSIISTKNAAKRWRQITHQIFEVPNQAGGILARLTVLRKYLHKNPNNFIKIIKQIPIKFQVQVNNFLYKIIQHKGEGVVVRNPNIPYQTGRTANALKIKKYQDDECIVIEILNGKGKYINKMGSIKCQLKHGNIIKIGSGFTDYERTNPPAIGTQITFKYYGLSKKGNYKYPVFLRKRPKLVN